LWRDLLQRSASSRIWQGGLSYESETAGNDERCRCVAYAGFRNIRIGFAWVPTQHVAIPTGADMPNSINPANARILDDLYLAYVGLLSAEDEAAFSDVIDEYLVPANDAAVNSDEAPRLTTAGCVTDEGGMSKRAA
jgi:hypothetical protein